MNSEPLNEMKKNHPSYRYIKELDYFNAIACLLVIFIHVTSVAISSLDTDSWQYFLIYIPWRLSSFVVPAFLFSGAVKMSQQLFVSENNITPYKLYIKERSKNILLPYSIFVIIYFVVFVLCDYMDPSLKTLTVGLFTGDISGQFYYIIIVVQFYILRPLWYLTLKKIPVYIGITVALLISMFSLKISDYLSLVDLQSPYVDRFFPLYIFFWVTGLYAGKFYDKFYDSLFKSRIVIWSIPVVLFGGTIITLLQTIHKNFILEMDYFKFILDVLSIILLLTICITLEKKSSLITVKLLKLLDSINRASYFVYLAHCLFITVFTFRLEISGINDISSLLAIRAIVGYTFPFILYKLWQSCKKIHS